MVRTSNEFRIQLAASIMVSVYTNILYSRLFFRPFFNLSFYILICANNSLMMTTTPPQPPPKKIRIGTLFGMCASILMLGLVVLRLNWKSVSIAVVIAEADE